MYLTRIHAQAGGLISYGPDQPALARRGAHYVDRILKGAKPAELPIEQPSKFLLAINLKTAKSLGLEIPPSLLARADEALHFRLWHFSELTATTGDVRSCKADFADMPSICQGARGTVGRSTTCCENAHADANA
jgi:ABC transporter substrate binding protein